jgi:hypothetical protein
MYLCDRGHDEVCYDGRNCPVCEAMKDAEKTEEKLTDEIESLTDEIESLKEGK